MANIRFYSLRQNDYDSLSAKNPAALYFIFDTKSLYRGDVKFSDQSAFENLSTYITSLSSFDSLSVNNLSCNTFSFNEMSADYIEVDEIECENILIDNKNAATEDYVDEAISEVKYTLKSIVLQNSGDWLEASIEPYTISKIEISSNSKPIHINLPAQPEDDSVRDFVIRFEVTCPEAPMVLFIPHNGEEIDYDTEDEEWATLQPGVNLFSFTETSRQNG